jgi:hypothetical protein
MLRERYWHLSCAHADVKHFKSPKGSEVSFLVTRDGDDAPAAGDSALLFDVRSSGEGSLVAVLEIADSAPATANDITLTATVELDLFHEPITIASIAGGQLRAALFSDLVRGKYNPIDGDEFAALVDVAHAAIASQLANISVGSPADIHALEAKYKDQTPMRRDYISSRIERGGHSELIKAHFNYRCVLCSPDNDGNLGFLKKDGRRRYIEAHHVFPISGDSPGLDAPSNIVAVCASHHRQLHYGNVGVEDLVDRFKFTIDGRPTTVKKAVDVG